MLELERIQTEHSAQPLRLDVATWGEDVNPMAPSAQDVSLCKSRGKSKVVATLTEVHGPPPAPSLSQPVFSMAAPGQQFGFRLPESGPQSQALSWNCFSAINSATSSQTSMPSALLFSGRSLSGQSTAPTSSASSVCSSTGRYTYSQVVQRQSPPHQPVSNRSTLLHPPLPSFIQGHSGPSHCISELFDNIPLSLCFNDFDDPEPEPNYSQSIAQLTRTASFYHLLLRMGSAGHSLSATPLVANKGTTTPEVRNFT